MKRAILCMMMAAAATAGMAQKSPSFVAYIDQYKDMAIDQMRRYHIPASITLAQGILESAAGQSYLATAANNHFGIKVGSAWAGPYVVKDDDFSEEKFRKYSSAKESYEDHSAILQRQRYASLFQLDPTDYKAWANGLKDAGYATNPKYPTLLINLIEEYDLWQYDRPESISTTTGSRTVYVNNVKMQADNEGIITYVEGEDDFDAESSYTYRPSSKGNRGYRNVRTITHEPRICNDVVYIIARQGDTYESLAAELGIDAMKLRQYNEVDPYSQVKKNDIIYLGKKQKHVAQRFQGTFHRVAPGESMHSIAQRYGIRISSLYNWSNLPANYRATTGDLLRLL